MTHLRWLIAAGGLLAAAPSAAALTVTPSVVETRAKAGEVVTGAFEVVNETATPVRVQMELEPLLGSGPTPDGWLQVTPQSFELAPGATTEVRYAVSVPEQQSGELSAMVVFAQAPSGGLQVRFGMALYVSVRGTERLAAALEPMTMDGGAETVVRVPVMNTGNVHCRPDGRVRLARGTAVVSESALPLGMPALPGQTEGFRVALPGGPFAPGAYQLSVELACHATGLAPLALSASQSGRVDAAGTWVGDATSATAP